MVICNFSSIALYWPSATDWVLDLSCVLVSERQIAETTGEILERDVSPTVLLKKKNCYDI